MKSDPNARSEAELAVSAEVQRVIAKQLARNYRFLLAFPESRDTVDMDAACMVERLREAGFEIVRVLE